MSFPGSTADPYAGFPNRATPPGSSAYYSTRFETGAQREATALLFAWRGVLRDVLSDCSDPGVARLKLQWWREEIARGRAGEAAHPLTRRLAPLFRRHALPLDPFTQMADAVEAEVRRLTPASMDDLENRAEQDQGALFELIGRCHGSTDAGRLATLRRLGRACGLVYLIRDLGAHQRRDYQPLPADVGPGRGTTRQLAAIAAQVRTLAAGIPPGLPPSVAARGAVLLALLDELERDGFPVLDQRICLTPLRKLWIAWRAGRRGAIS